MAILETILIVLIVYYLLKILAKKFGPTLLRYAAKKTEKKFREAMENQTRGTYQHTAEQEGEVTIERPNNPSGYRSKKKVGEYIEFEEVD